MNIDREIAEKVMGFKQAQSNLRKPYWKDRFGAYVCLVESWTPATNIKHAMEVEAEMCRKGWWITISKETWGWEVEFSKMNDPESEVSADSKSLPEAICLAALEAKKG